MKLSQQKQLILKEYAARVTKMQEDLRSLSLCIKTEQEIELPAKNMAKINGIIAQVDESGAAISKLGEQFSSMHHSHINETVTHGFHLAGFFMSVFNFVRIPAIYLIAYLTNQKIPLTLGNNARWLHATILLGLAVVALSVPALAPIIAFASASVLGLVVSLFLPGMGLGIVAGVGIAAASYALLRVITPVVVHLVRRLSQREGVLQADEQVDKDYSCGSNVSILLNAVDCPTTSAAIQQQPAPSSDQPSINDFGGDQVTIFVTHEPEHEPKPVITFSHP